MRLTSTLATRIFPTAFAYAEWMAGGPGTPPARKFVTIVDRTQFDRRSNPDGIYMSGGQLRQKRAPLAVQPTVVNLEPATYPQLPRKTFYPNAPAYYPGVAPAIYAKPRVGRLRATGDL